ncbi:cytochrome b/b6 domain-containing protein [Salipiger sp. H15]|uniref:Cytochrome b/b6 domain-containing protein n=1 Tax=Alloyangia sp. H15 TaxID=3029062 RepID=A0AAU8AMR7_9RHOB
MRLGNSPDGYGLVSRILHWGMALAILAMLGLGTGIHRMTPDLSNLWLYGLHKSVGLTLLGLILLRLGWHRLSPPPVPRGVPGSWQLRLARAVHRALYLLLLAIPLTGWAASSATGIDTVYFGTWTVPAIAPPSESLSDLGFAVHGALTKLLLLLLLVHVAGALRHGAGRDGALRRMWTG